MKNSEVAGSSHPADNHAWVLTSFIHDLPTRRQHRAERFSTETRLSSGTYTSLTSFSYSFRMGFNVPYRWNFGSVL